MSDVTTIRDEIAKRISESGPIVLEGMIAAIVKRTVDNRVQQLDQGYSILDNLERDLRKIKPDLVAMNEAGEQVAANYSKDRYDQRKKLVEQKDKMNRAIEKALTSGDFSDLTNAIGKGGGKDGG